MKSLSTIENGQHIAHIVPFDLLVSKLRGQVSKGNVSCAKHGSLTLYNYKNQTVFSNDWSLYSLIARGLILDEENKKIIATPFPKFFNFQELPDKLPNESFAVTEKADGSLGIIYFYNDVWRVATRGSFDSDQAIWAETFLHTYVNIEKLIPGYTYLAEIIYPENKIIIKYDFAGLVLLSCFDDRGFELSYEQLSNIATDCGFRLIKQQSFESIDQIIDICKSLGKDQEGFVIRFKSGFRVKIKGDEYCRLHKLVSNCTPIAVWEMMFKGDNLNKVKKELPEEFYSDFDKIVGILQKKFDDFIAKLELVNQETKDLSNKEIGLKINTLVQKYGDCVRLIFSYRNNMMDNIGIRQCVFKSFRPTGNFLEGYSSSVAMNRVKRES